MFEPFDKLKELLETQKGIAIGNIVEKKAFNLIDFCNSESSEEPKYNTEKALEKLDIEIGFALVEDRCFRLSHIETILAQLETKITPHGFMVVLLPKEGKESQLKPVDIIQRIVQRGTFEFMAQYKKGKDYFFLFRLFNEEEARMAKTVASEGPINFRYRVADKLADGITKVPGLEPALKKSISFAWVQYNKLKTPKKS